MRILLMRHGAAVAYGLAERDEDRWLTEKGRQDAQRVAGLLRGEGLAFDAVHTSPLVCAVQTAELLADGVDCPTVVTHAAMAPDRGGVDDALRLPRGPELIALVGHEPKIRQISQRLGGTAAGSGFSTAEARLFESTKDRYRLILTIDAEGLRRL